jgi:hypothetical protein
VARVNFKRKNFWCERIKGFEDVWETNLEAVPLNATSSTLFCACLCGECGRRAASLQVLLVKALFFIQIFKICLSVAHLVVFQVKLCLQWLQITCLNSSCKG